jgi:hypothetical protein
LMPDDHAAPNASPKMESTFIKSRKQKTGDRSQNE